MEVIWDSERFDVDLPVDSFTLGTFKHYLSSRTGVPEEHMKLFCNAGLMKGDNTPLSVFRLDPEDQLDSKGQPNGYLKRNRLWDGIFFGLKKRQVPPMRIRMVHSKETRAVVSDRPDLEPSSTLNSNLNTQPISSLHTANEPRIILLINELIQKTLGDNLPKIERYEGIVSSESSLKELHPSDGSLETQLQTQWDSTQFACLSEVLLQVLLQLDGFEIESEWTEARMARKEGVRAVQKLLDRLDSVKVAKGISR